MQMLDPHQQQNGSDSRNMFMAVALAAVAIVGYEFFTKSDEAQAPVTLETPQVQENVVVTDGGAALPGAPENLNADKAQLAASVVAKETVTAPRVAIHSDLLEGSISLKGGRVDELALPHYKKELHGDESVTLFRSGGENAHFFDAGWLSTGIKAPDGNTTWRAEGSMLTEKTPLTLTWDNGQGQTFKRIFTLGKDSYAIAVTDSVVNSAPSAVQLTHYAQIHKTGVEIKGTASMYDMERSTFYNFMGPMGLVDEIRVESDYEDLQDVPVKRDGTQGWIGITSHYFMAALVPDQLTPETFLWRHSKAGGKDYYTTIMQPQQAESVAPGQTFSYDYTLYAGPKARGELEKVQGHLDRAIDYGWFDVIARPIYWLVMQFHNIFGNFGLAIIFTTIILKTVMYPLAYKSYSSMAKMRKLQPRLTQLKERYGDKNKEQFAMEMMALYREHRVNPLSGCWPTFIQIPIFFAFYKVILISFEFRHAPIALWIEDMSAMDPYFVLPILMGISMLVQMRLSPSTGDPAQAMMMKILPVVFTFMFLWFPSGLVLYWLTNNVITVLQQYYVMKRLA